MMLSFNGVITFKNANRVREMVEYIPIDRIMLETDCPYMTPVPLRGKRNEPKNVIYVAQTMANIKKISVEEVIDITKQNALRFFNIKDEI
jgi:TatD DNase family protein